MNVFVLEVGLVKLISLGLDVCHHFFTDSVVLHTTFLTSSRILYASPSFFLAGLPRRQISNSPLRTRCSALPDHSHMYKCDLCIQHTLWYIIRHFKAYFTIIGLVKNVALLFNDVLKTCNVYTLRYTILSF